MRLYSMHLVILSQWREYKMGEIWQDGSFNDSTSNKIAKKRKNGNVRSVKLSFFVLSEK